MSVTPLEELVVTLSGNDAGYTAMFRTAEATATEVANAINAACTTIASATQRQNAIMREAAAITTAVRTPAEAYGATARRLGEYLAGGAITQETYNRAIQEARSQLPSVIAAQELYNKDIRDAAKWLNATRTPQEAYAANVRELHHLLRQGAITQETYNRALTHISPTAAARQQEYNEAVREGQRITAAMQTPLELYQQEIAQLNILLRQGHITQETHNRAVRNAADAYHDATAAANTTLRSLGHLTLAFGSLGGALGQMVATLGHVALAFGGMSAGAAIAVGGLLVGVRAAQAMTHAMAELGVKAITLASDLERAEVAFTTMFRSADKAKVVIMELKQFAAATPFEFPELQQAGVKLAGFGIAAQQIAPTLKMLGDLAAGVGTSIGELAETYGKARIQGRAFSRDIYEFSNRGVPIQEALARVLGVTKEEVMDLVEEGSVGFAEIQTALKSLVDEGGQFEGGLQAQSQTAHGLYSTLKDNLNMALADLGTILTKELHLKEVLHDFIKLTNNMGGLVRVTADAVLLVKELGGAFADLMGEVPMFGLKGAADAIKNSFTTGQGNWAYNLRRGLAFLRGDYETLTELANRSTTEMQEATEAARELDALEIELTWQGPTQTKEQVKLKEDIEKLIESMLREIDATAMSANEIKIKELRTRGLTAAIEAQLVQLAKDVELAKEKKKADDELKRAEERRLNSISELVKRLHEEAATTGMSTAAKHQWQLAQLQAGQNTMQLVGILDAEIERKKNLIEQDKELERLLNSITPKSEKLKKAQFALDEAFALGTIDGKEYDMMLKELRRQFAAAAGDATKLGDAMASGSQEAEVALEAYYAALGQKPLAATAPGARGRMGPAVRAGMTNPHKHTAIGTGRNRKRAPFIMGGGPRQGQGMGGGPRQGQGMGVFNIQDVEATRLGEGSAEDDGVKEALDKIATNTDPKKQPRPIVLQPAGF